MELLKSTWWIEDPIDFEHKKYILLAYLQKIEKKFFELEFSPYLLHAETLYDDMLSFLEFFYTFKDSITSQRLLFDRETIGWIKEEPPSIDELDTFLEILEFATPLLKERIQQGKRLWMENPTLLW